MVGEGSDRFEDPKNFIVDLYDEMNGLETVGPAAKIITATVIGTAGELNTISECEALWSKLDSNVKELIKGDPEEVFQTALFLINLRSQSKDPESQRAINWMQSSGFTILAFPEMQDRLITYLDSPQGEALTEILHDALNFDTNGFTVDQSWMEPRSFSKFAALAAVANIRWSDPTANSARLEQAANAIRRDPIVRTQAMTVYATSEDSIEIVKRIYQTGEWEWDRADDLIVEMERDSASLRASGIAQVIVDNINRQPGMRYQLSLDAPSLFFHLAEHFSTGGTFRSRGLSAPPTQDIMAFYLHNHEYVGSSPTSLMANLSQDQQAIIEQIFQKRAGVIAHGAEQSTFNREWHRRSST